MDTIALRDHLHAYVTAADDQKIQALYLVLEAELQHQLLADVSDEDRRAINEERQRHKRGEGKSSPSDEVLARLEASRVHRHAA